MHTQMLSRHMPKIKELEQRDGLEASGCEEGGDEGGFGLAVCFVRPGIVIGKIMKTKS